MYSMMSLTNGIIGFHQQTVVTRWRYSCKCGMYKLSQIPNKPSSSLFFFHVISTGVYSHTRLFHITNGHKLALGKRQWALVI